MPDDILALSRQFRAALLANDSAAAARMTTAYQGVTEAIDADLTRLIRQIEAEQAAGRTVSGAWVRRQERYRALMAQVESQIGRFSGVAGQVVVAGQRQAVASAGRDTAAFVPPTIATRWNSLPFEATETLVGSLSPGSPLAGVLVSYAPNASAAIEKALIRGLALGKPLRQVARDVRDEAAVPLNRALCLSRTEIPRSYRGASLATYRDNRHLIAWWIWLASLSPRTCRVCIAMHGTRHAVDEEFGSHPNCRCTTAPVFIGQEGTVIETGEQWLARQTDSMQNTILGSRQAGDALRAGRVRARDFVEERHDKVWGLSRSARSFRQVSDVAFRSMAPGGPIDPDPRGTPGRLRLTADTNRVVRFVETETGLSSRWTGQVSISNAVDAQGQPLFSARKLMQCPIEYHQIILGAAEFYWAALEEALHSCSVMPHSPTVLRLNHENMEEGVVSSCIELLKRKYSNLFANDALPMASVPPIPSFRPYLPQMQALGTLRQRTGLSPDAFYFPLLATPLDDRERQIIQWIATHEGAAEADIQSDAAVQASFAQLRRR